MFQRLYISTARQLKRIDSVRRSPIYIHFDESVVGTSSIRAYRREEQFIAKMDKYIDNSQKPWYLIIVAQRLVSYLQHFNSVIAVFISNNLNSLKYLILYCVNVQ